MNPEDVQYAKANRQMVAERTALLAELNAARTALAQRSANTLVEAVEGLEQLTAQAGRGDQASRVLLGRLTKALEAARLLNSGIVLATGQNGAT